MRQKLATIVVEVELPVWEGLPDRVRKRDAHERHPLLVPAPEGGAAPAEPVPVVAAHYHHRVLHQAGGQGGAQEAGDLGIDC